MSLTLKMEAVHPSKMFITTCKTTHRHNPRDRNRHLHHFENVKSQ
jgi:hypothetical protein